ncbi:MAG: hypothetical protein ABW163_04820 [Luteimonas sp.]
MTPLDKALRRELTIGDQAYTLTLDPAGLKLVEKGRRNGVEVRWTDLVAGNGNATPGASLPPSPAKD